ncbi:PREDICTED: alanine--tRNA ligase, mitochondrial [Vollenhovia emeryi]|uniref:alanine--tRNA ligase, mitochondrial n=1 Tax=Vollenhovia emeryi TaxID=411798 RepID=UPI0005F3B9AA|nr:PREDICTED: alanine--tRNA ligase, mitochondrial [Vollenhovia emeryi]
MELFARAGRFSYYSFTGNAMGSMARGMISFRSIRRFSRLANSRPANLIRQEFLDYFTKDLKHSFIRSSPVSSITDQSLMFINAGMNQFKGIFLNYYEPPATRVANSQKCIRVGGKHNDLSVVGNDSYHHTFFEMLGNWSFGDYFKEDACSYAWDLLTNVYGIPEERLYVTYFGGNEELGISPDLECKDIWLRLGLPECKVLPFGMRDNFWEMGVSGPCGPCTEIHVDYVKRPANQADRVNKGYADLMELWNIVFIQYERLANGCIVPLPNHHVDTGMGLERLVTLLQGKMSNYDTDLFQPLFDAIRKHSRAPEYRGTFGDDDAGRIDYGYRILADHARMITVALADNMLPEQHPKLRRVLRNAIGVGEKVFRKSGIISELACDVADNLGVTYPELHTNLKQVQRVIDFEEDLLKRLRNTSGKMWSKMIETRRELAAITDWMAPGLVDGYKDLQSALKGLRKTNVLPGSVAFKLYDTYGLNSETIAELAQIESLHFDEVDFEEQLNIRRYQSRLGLDKHSAVITKESLGILEENRVPKTDDSFKYSYTYDGNTYEFPALSSKLIGFILNGELVASKSYSDITIVNNADNKIAVGEVINSADEIGIILDRTVCYSLEGGQVSDRGNIRVKNLLFNVDNVRKVNGYVIHSGRFAETDLPTSELHLQIEDDCLVSVEPNIRVGAMKHHTAAHLLNAALKKVMQVVYQRGCTVDADNLKFQFNSFGEQLTSEQMRTVEDCINNVIQSRAATTVQTVNSLDLLKQNDVTLVPGEIYPYTDIKVVEINTDNLKAKETCCGTHVHNTGVLQHFCFLSYASKGATKRIVKAVVGPGALRMKQAGERMCQRIAELEDTSQSGEFAYETFNVETNRIKQEINDQHVQVPLPYLVKEKCLTYLENLNKIVWLREKESERDSIIREITNATDSSSCFIVHCLNKNPTYLSLHEVTSLFSGVPMLVLSCTNEFVKARCSIPQETASSTFNAQTWMNVILQIFNAEHGPVKGFKPMLVASMKSTKVSQDLQIRMERAIAEAIKYAATHVKKVEPVTSKTR